MATTTVQSLSVLITNAPVVVYLRPIAATSTPQALVAVISGGSITVEIDPAE